LDWCGLWRWELISEKSATLVGCGSNVDDFSEIIYERLKCGRFGLVWPVALGADFGEISDLLFEVAT
jgi:hypothetical protein